MSKILLVEDKKPQYEELTRRIEGRGHQVVLATTGAEALEKLSSEGCDLILLDLRLPDMNGYEVTRAIRAIQEHESVPIMALTAYALVEDRKKALAAGCDDYHAKPVAFIQLMRQIDELLNRQEQV